MKNLEQDLSLISGVTEQDRRDLDAQSSLKSGRQYTSGSGNVEYKGLNPLGSVVFSGGTSIKYWM